MWIRDGSFPGSVAERLRPFPWPDAIDTPPRKGYHALMAGAPYRSPQGGPPMNRRTFSLFALFILSASLWAEAPEYAPAVKEITVFKDGHALVRAEGETKLEDGWCRLKDVPAPLL